MLVVIPALNEAATVAGVIRRVRSELGCDVLVVSDAGRDATSARARAAGATVIELPLRLGAWGATQTGLRYAIRRGYVRVATIDADGQHHPEALTDLLDSMQRDGANVVIGTCAQRLSLAKRIASRYFQLLTGIGIRDFTSGMRVYDHRALKVLAAPEASLLDYQDIGVLMLLSRHGLTLAEVPTVMSPRRSGSSRIFASWLLVARYMVATTLLCIAQIGVRPQPLHGAANGQRP